MEEAIQTVVKVFLKSGKGKDSLGPKDFQNLVKSQLGNILTDTESKEAVNNMGKGLDANKDGKVGFEEYMRLVGYLAKAVSEQRSRGNQAQPEQKGHAAENAAAENAAPENAAPENAAPEAETPVVKAVADADGKTEAKLDVKTEAEQAEKPAEVSAPGVELTPAAANASAPGPDVTSPAANVTSPSAQAVAKKEIPEAGETEKMVEEAAEKMADAAEEEAKMKPEESATS
ncbi:S100 calcium binding protein U [Hippocampus zosterae]|uniref:S100 calcium binding protein U n=1 Tax=Hippocampus zosterae TaxID=109293 RepID=UPI00223C8DB5|nr:S100 calcium binding protein U [Hippocampus zosterae]